MNLYREAIKALDWGKSTAYVFGHRSPDADSVMSSIAYASLMKSLGYDVEACLADKPNHETLFLAKAFDIKLPRVKQKVESEDRLILVDHSDYAQAVEGARNARILQVIDHHGIGDIAESHLLYAKYMPVGSACSIIYASFIELDVEISFDVAKILFAGILSDSLNLGKVTTTEMDREVYASLLSILAKYWNMNASAARAKVDEIFRGAVDAAHDFSSMTDEEIFNFDAKNYVIGGVKIRLGSLDWPDVVSIDRFADRMLEAMAKVMKSMGIPMTFCRIGFGERTYMLYAGEGASERVVKLLAETAFGESIRHGVIYCDRRLSRKLDVIPMLTRALNG